jgi:HPt (histidine-containing phosphotransfer) domain-containing protein
MSSAQEETMAFDRVTNNGGSRNNSRPHVAAYQITNDALDMETLSVFEELRPADGSSLIVEMIDRYVLDAAQRVSQIREASIGTDWLMLKRAAHKLQRRSSNLGVRKVAEICQKLEWVDRHDSPQTVAALVRLLEYESAMANAALTAVRQRRLACDL